MQNVFVISKIKNIVLWTYVISDLNGEDIDRTFYEQEFQKTSQKNLWIEKMMKRKGDKLFVKWKRYDSSLIVRLIKKTLYKNESILS